MKCNQCNHQMSRHYKKYGDKNITCSVNSCICEIHNEDKERQT